MKIIKTKIKDLLIIEPQIFEDKRGYFFESYNEQKFKNAGLDYNWVQDNQSQSGYGTIRALHFQKGKNAQAKLVRVLEGAVLDVAVDLRPKSKTFGQHVAVELSADNNLQLLIPRGFAHGYAVLSKKATFFYKCDNFYNKESEGGLLYKDPKLGIDWQIDEKDVIISERDDNFPLLKDIK